MIKLRSRLLAVVVMIWAASLASGAGAVVLGHPAMAAKLIVPWLVITVAGIAVAIVAIVALLWTNRF